MLLQQTRVAQATPYYKRFLERFPTVQALAGAPLSGVLKVWEGAGYYARARHLHRAARQLVRESSGRLPGEVAALERLPGVGRYIARALASLAFDRPVVALEANGVRVAARWWLERGDPTDRRVRGRLERHLEDELPRARPGAYNEALMELGETVCLPRVPRCEICPVSRWCLARERLADPDSLPRRRAPVRRPHVVATVVAIEHRGRWLVQRRAPSGLLGGLWEFPGGKIEPGESPVEAGRRELLEETGVTRVRLEPVGEVRHSYSHFTVTLHVLRGRIPSRRRPSAIRSAQWLTPEQFARRPRPGATVKVVRLLESRKARPGAASPG